MSFLDKIISLTRQLYPRGRAFYMPFNGNLERLHRALSLSEDRLQADIVSVLDSAIPDNDNFTEQDATDWEKRLGLITSEGVSLSDRKLAIKRKINFPGTIPARQSYLYLQDQLQAAGFDVYVYENRFPDGMGGYITKTPYEVSLDLGIFGQTQYGDGQYGATQYGLGYNNKIVNHIEEHLDFFFDTGDNLRSTFFIGGNPIGSFAIVNPNRKNEFRQLILKIKPVQTVGFLFVNYI